MTRSFLRITLVLLATVFLASQADAGGKFRVYNETNQGIHPWFKSPCWNPDFVTATGWVFFGGIGARGQFEWDFTGLTTCGDLEFTYTTNVVAPQDPVKGNHRANFTLGPDANVVLQVGEGIRCLELEGPGENGR